MREILCKISLKEHSDQWYTIIRTAKKHNNLWSGARHMSTFVQNMDLIIWAYHSKENTYRSRKWKKKFWQENFIKIIKKLKQNSAVKWAFCDISYFCMQRTLYIYYIINTRYSPCELNTHSTTPLWIVKTELNV